MALSLRNLDRMTKAEAVVHRWVFARNLFDDGKRMWRRKSKAKEERKRATMRVRKGRVLRERMIGDGRG
jgi:hypothetical protein